MRNIKQVEGDEVSRGQKQFWQSRKWNVRQPEDSQTRGRSAQERIGNDRWCFTIKEEPQICQLREWHLHCCQHIIQLAVHKAREGDSIYATALPKCHNDVVHA